MLLLFTSLSLISLIQSTVWSGKGQWSCCLAEEQNAQGCIDEHSLGIRSSLGNIKDSFHNYVKLPPQIIGFRESSQIISSNIHLHSKIDISRHQERALQLPSHSIIRPISSTYRRNEKAAYRSHSSDYSIPHQKQSEISHIIFQAPSNDEGTGSELLNHQASTMSLIKENIGKLRQSHFSRLSGNRPMSSPGLYHAPKI